MIKHIVFWTIKEDALGKSKSEIIETIRQKIEGLKSVIPEIQEIEIGRDFNGSEHAFDLALYSEFKSINDLSIYQNHPEHKKVAGFIKSVTLKRAVVDYSID